MTLWEALLLAIVEGLTEFLPISSTGHLILVSTWLGKEKDTFFQDYEIIIQGGAILAVIVYSWRNLWQITLYPKITLAFLPTAAIGFIAKDFVTQLLGAPEVVAINLLLGGIVLVFLDRWLPGGEEDMNSLSWKKSAIVGLVQSLSLLPGVSRAAAALVGSRWVGLEKKAAAQFSFLIAVPTLLAASLYRLWKGATHFTSDQIPLLLLGSGVAFAVGLLSMHLLISLWQRFGLAPLGVYRILLGAIVLLWLHR
ncbi:MAG: undecaprenyl-diphosphate phosphatase [Bacteroidia bacterium]|nr:undecaprenyl-diphosphate phosphatase [Bacteroidia bacterium]MDW8236691.1 undecaprenyl-diphosphate phosphatase [Bacteroidia bacterium]